jgi:hypothetical protein
MESEVGTSALRPQWAMVVIAGPCCIVNFGPALIRRGRRVEFGDELERFVLEGGIVVVRVLAHDGDDLAIAVGSFSVLTSGLVDHPEAIPPIMHIGKAFEQVARD